MQFLLLEEEPMYLLYQGNRLTDNSHAVVNVSDTAAFG